MQINEYDDDDDATFTASTEMLRAQTNQKVDSGLAYVSKAESGLQYLLQCHDTYSQIVPIAQKLPSVTVFHVYVESMIVLGFVWHAHSRMSERTKADTGDMHISY